MRIGFGYDVHKLSEGRKFILGGVEIPFEKGLLGHSDADVLAHAIIDALYGAAALGDIGSHFPDTDDKYKNADSMILLQKCCNNLNDSGYAIVNVDTTVICQHPKLAPFIEAIREKIANTIGINIAQISVKAKTEERLGFTGDGSGVKAYAVALIES